MFLSFYNLLVDCRNKSLIDGTTNMSVTARQHESSDDIASVKVISGESEYHAILCEFPEVTRPAGTSNTPMHNTVHHIRTTPGPPVACKPRRLDPERLKAAKKEFDDLLASGTAQRSEQWRDHHIS